MSNLRNISPEGAVLDQASLWVYRLDRGLSQEEKEELGVWLAQSEQHRWALIKVGQVWDKAEVLTKLADLFPAKVVDRAQSRWKMPAIAASVAALLVSLWMFGSLQLGQLGEPAVEGSSDIIVSNLESLYKTAVGEHTRVSLPDGTELTLNTNTTVRVNYSETQRLVVLDQGELHIQVAHDPDRPLSVLVGGQVVQAVGTAFNIELRADRSVDLLVTEGKVLVGDREAVPEEAESFPQIRLPVSSTAVSEGEQIMLGQLGESVQSVDLEEIEIQLSWRHGNLVFRGEPLEEAVKEISRYNSVEFVFLEENLKSVRVAGLFETGDVDGLLSALSDGFQIDSQRVDHRILLSSR